MYKENTGGFDGIRAYAWHLPTDCEPDT